MERGEDVHGAVTSQHQLEANTKIELHASNVDLIVRHLPIIHRTRPLSLS